MASPRITIDQLPTDDTVSGTEYLVLQDGATTKKVTMETVRAANGVDAHLTDATDAHAASAIGAISSGAPFDGPSVQLQLGQLASATTSVTNQVATNTDNFNGHIAGTSGKHSASAITADNTGRTFVTGAQLDAQLDAADAQLVTIVGRTITTTAPLAGGGDLSINRSLTINNFAGSAPGAVPSSPGGAAHFLRADSAWAIPPTPTPPTYSVANLAALPVAASATGQQIFVLDTKTVMVSDGTAWHIAYGDTGWRKMVNTDFATGWQGSGGYLYLRRVSNVVYYRLNAVPTSAGADPASGTMYVLSAGLRPYLIDVPAGDTVLYAETAGATPSIAVMRPDSSSGGALTVMMAGRLVDSFLFIRGGGSFATTDAWPTTLPGTAQGTIP